MTMIIATLAATLAALAGRIARITYHTAPVSAAERATRERSVAKRALTGAV
jgi:hypothetical protein